MQRQEALLRVQSVSADLAHAPGMGHAAIAVATSGLAAVPA
jgi:hypothetical protein